MAYLPAHFPSLELSLGASTTLWCLSHLCPFVITKPAVGALCPITQVSGDLSRVSSVTQTWGSQVFPAHSEDSLLAETLLPEILVILELSCINILQIFCQTHLIIIIKDNADYNLIRELPFSSSL